MCNCKYEVMPESAFEDFPGLGFPVKDITCAFVRPINLGEDVKPRNRSLQEYVDKVLSCGTYRQAQYDLELLFIRGCIPHHIKRYIENYLYMVEDCTDGYIPGVKLQINKPYHTVRFFYEGKVTEMTTSNFDTFEWRGRSLSLSKVKKVIKPNWIELIKIKIQEWIEQKQCDTYDLV